FRDAAVLPDKRDRRNIRQQPSRHRARLGVGVHEDCTEGRGRHHLATEGSRLLLPKGRSTISPTPGIPGTSVNSFRSTSRSSRNFAVSGTAGDPTGAGLTSFTVTRNSS